MRIDVGDVFVVGGVALEVAARDGDLYHLNDGPNGAVDVFATEAQLVACPRVALVRAEVGHVRAGVAPLDAAQRRAGGGP